MPGTHHANSYHSLPTLKCRLCNFEAFEAFQKAFNQRQYNQQYNQREAEQDFGKL